MQKATRGDNEDNRVVTGKEEKISVLMSASHLGLLCLG